MERMNFNEDVSAAATPPEVGPAVPMGTYVTKTYRVGAKLFDPPAEVPEARPRPKAKAKAKKARAKVTARPKTKAKPRAARKRPAKKKAKARARKRTR